MQQKTSQNTTESRNKSEIKPKNNKMKPSYNEIKPQQNENQATERRELNLIKPQH